MIDAACENPVEVDGVWSCSPTMTQLKADCSVAGVAASVALGVAVAAEHAAACLLVPEPLNNIGSGHKLLPGDKVEWKVRCAGSLWTLQD